MSYNKIFLMGNLGKEPEVRQFDNGQIVSFTLATTERAYTNKAGVQVPEHTDWHNCTCFGSTANYVASYLHKGNKVFVEGKVRYRSYEQNGTTKWVTEIIVDKLENLTPKSESQGVYQQYPQAPQPQYAPPAQPQYQQPQYAPPAPNANEIPGFVPPAGFEDF